MMFHKEELSLESITLPSVVLTGKTAQLALEVLSICLRC